MATASPTRTEVPDAVIELPEAGWDGFRALLEMKGDRRFPRTLFLDGSLTLVSPSLPHEGLSRRLGLFVLEVAVGLGLPCAGIGSTTLDRADLDCGVEGDQAFYLANAGHIVGKEKLDLKVDPPPDLAIEVVVPHGAKRAMEIYRRLGVPELWVCTPKRLRFFRLGEDGAYRETPVSDALPPLSPSEVFGWVDRPTALIDTEWIARLREWVRDELARRARGG